VRLARLAKDPLAAVGVVTDAEAAEFFSFRLDHLLRCPKEFPLAYTQGLCLFGLLRTCGRCRFFGLDGVVRYALPLRRARFFVFGREDLLNHVAGRIRHKAFIIGQAAEELLHPPPAEWREVKKCGEVDGV